VGIAALSIGLILFISRLSSAVIVFFTNQIINREKSSTAAIIVTALANISLINMKGIETTGTSIHKK
jgi:hypothetical protein